MSFDGSVTMTDPFGSITVSLRVVLVPIEGEELKLTPEGLVGSGGGLPLLEKAAEEVAMVTRFLRAGLLGIT